jgi:hypothetical protein
MRHHQIAEVNSRNRSRRRVDLQNATDIKSELGSILGQGQEGERADLADALDAFVGQSRKSRPHFTEDAESLAAMTQLHAEHRVNAPAVIGDVRDHGGRRHRQHGLLARIEVDLGLCRRPSREIEREAPAGAYARRVEAAQPQ